MHIQNQETWYNVSGPEEMLLIVNECVKISKLLINE